MLSLVTSSPSLLSQVGRLTLTSVDGTGHLAPTDNMAIVGTALPRRFSLYGSFSAMLERGAVEGGSEAVAGVGRSTAEDDPRRRFAH
jgi:hypothetical protein